MKDFCFSRELFADNNDMVDGNYKGKTYGLTDDKTKPSTSAVPNKYAAK